ncbi:unnamed protein product [Symbiodinium microadriaticum]|nr:unnamed protein product [Symbiodinium microadriaticum]
MAFARLPMESLKHLPTPSVLYLWIWNLTAQKPQAWASLKYSLTMAFLCWAVVLLASNVPARGEEEPRGTLKIETFSWKGGDRVERIVRTLREDDDEEGIFKTFHHNKTAGARGTQAR